MSYKSLFDIDFFFNVALCALSTARDSSLLNLSLWFDSISFSFSFNCQVFFRHTKWRLIWTVNRTFTCDLIILMTFTRYLMTLITFTCDLMTLPVICDFSSFYLWSDDFDDSYPWLLTLMTFICDLLSLMTFTCDLMTPTTFAWDLMTDDFFFYLWFDDFDDFYLWPDDLCFGLMWRSVDIKTQVGFSWFTCGRGQHVFVTYVACELFNVRRIQHACDHLCRRDVCTELS